MPLYEYRCPVCEFVDALFRPVDRRNELPECAECEAEMERIYTGQTHKPSRHKKNPPYPIPKWT